MRVSVPWVAHGAHIAVMSAVMLERLLPLLALLYAVVILVATVHAHDMLAYWPHGVLLAVCWVIVPQMLQAWHPFHHRRRGR